MYCREHVRLSVDLTRRTARDRRAMSQARGTDIHRQLRNLVHDLLRDPDGGTGRACARPARPPVQLLPAFCRANRPVNVNANLSSAMAHATALSPPVTSPSTARRSARSFLARWTRSPRLLDDISGSKPHARLKPWSRSRSNETSR